MADEYKISLSATLDESSSSSLQSQINRLNLQPFKIKLDTSMVDAQIKIIKSQIQDLSNIKINLGVGNTKSGVYSIKQETTAYKELLSIANQIDKLSLKTGGMKFNGGDIKNAASQLEDLRSRYDQLYRDIATKSLDEESFKVLSSQILGVKNDLITLESELTKTQSKFVTTIKTNIANDTFRNQIGELENKFNTLDVDSQKVSNNIITLKSLLASMDASDDIESVVSDYGIFKNTLIETTNQVKELKREQSTINAANNLSNAKTVLGSKIDVWLKNHSAAAKQFGAQLREIQSQIMSATDIPQLNNLNSQVEEITRQAELAGVAGKTMGDRFKQSFGTVASYLSAAMLISRGANTLKKSISEVIELDTALVDLKKTSNATGQELQKFYYDANETAKKLGQTTKDIIQSAADWSRLGFNLKDSRKMAEVSSIFTSISPDLDMNEAVNGLVSVMKAFHIEADEALDGIASKINIIGNTQAVSNGNIVEFLQKSSAAMANANNTLEETIALGTAATEITRDAANVGTMLKTISMRIRGYDEETEEYIGNVEQLSGAIADLTKTASNTGGISLFTDDTKTEYKSTIQILREINQIWDELTDKQRAQLTEKLGGKRGGQIIGSLMTNWQAVEKSLNSMANSSGNAMEEMGIITESLEYKLNALKETAVGISQNLFDSKSVGATIDLLTKLLEVLDWLTEKFGALGIVIPSVGIYKFIKNLDNIKDLGVVASTLEKIGKGATDVNAVSDACKGLSLNQTKLILSTTALSKEEREAILTTYGLKDAELENAAASTTAATSTNIFAKSLANAKNIGKGFLVTLKSLATNPMTWIILIPTIISSIVHKIKEAKEEALQTAKDTVQAYQDNANTLNEVKEKLDEIVPKYEQLSKGVNNVTGEVSLSNDEYNEYLDVCNQIADMFPSLIQGYDNQGNAILSCKGNVEELTQAYNDMVVATNSAVLVQGKTLFEDFKDKSEDFKKTNFKGNKMTSTTIDHLEKILFSNDIDTAIQEYASTYSPWGVQINKALQDAGLEQGAWESNQDFIKRSIQENRGIVLAIVNDFKSQMNNAISDLKPVADAYVSNLLSSGDYDNLTPEIHKQIKSIINSFDITFYDQFDTVDDLYSHLRLIVDEYNNFFSSTQIEKLSALASKMGENVYAGVDNAASLFFQSLRSYNLTDNELNLAYQLSFTNEYDSVQDLIDDIRGAVDEAKNGVGNPDLKIDFETLMQDKNFTDSIDNYISKTEKLQDALKKLRNNDFENKNLVELVELFPRLANTTDNLEYGIKSLLDSMNNDLVDTFASQFKNMETSEDVVSLQNFQNAVLELGRVVGNTQFSINIDTATEGMDKFYSAIKESVSSIGLTAESIKNLKTRYQDLEKYDAAKLFERTANGVHLNTKALRELESEYEKQEKLKIKNALNDLVKQYNDLTDKINSNISVSEKANLYQQRQNILNRINDTADLAAQYEGLTSAFYKWQKAQSIGEEGDMYDSLANGLEDIKKLYDEGLIGTNKFRAAVQLMSNEDLSNATIEQLLEAYDSGYEIMTKYFTDSSDGCLNFLNDLQKLNSQWVSMNDDGSWNINFGLGNDEEVAKTLGINVEAVQSIMRKLSDYGFNINLDSTLSALDLCKTSAEEANKSLIELGKTEIVFQFNTNDIDSINSQIIEAQKLLDNFKNSDGTVDLSLKGAKEAQEILVTLITNRQLLSAPEIMQIDTSAMSVVDENLANAVSKLQEFVRLSNNLEIQRKLSIDTFETQNKLQKIVGQIQDIPDEIKTEIGLDDESFATTLKSIQDTKIDVDAGVNISENDVLSIQTVIGNIKAKNIELLTNSSTVNNELEKVNDFTIDNKQFSVTISNSPMSELQKINSYAFNDKHINIIAQHGNKYNSRGRAFAKGDWDVDRSGFALGGELGEELLVRDGHFYTIGDNSAEFFKYRKGDIIFDANQTKQIFKYGKILSGNKRGSAYAEGAAFSNGIGSIRIGGAVTTSGSGEPNNDSNNDFKETLDWIEIAIDRIERAINKLDLKANSIYRSWKSRFVNLKSEISKVTDEISLQQQAYNRYIKESNSVGLSESWAKKVRDGKIDIATIKDKDLNDKISQYKEWYEKAIKCKDAINQLNENLGKLYKTAFDDTQTWWGQVITVVEHEKSMIEELINQSGERGYITSIKYYNALISRENSIINKYTKERQALLSKLQEGLESGAIIKGSEAWYEMTSNIDEITLNIEKANTEILKFKNNIRDIKWEIFDLIQNKISNITSEAEFLINLMKNSDLFDDRGQLTDIGMATMGLHGQNYNVYMVQAAKYAEEIISLNKQIAKDPYNQDIINRRQDLIKLQQDSISSAEAEKIAIKELVEDGIEKELSALKDLIDEYENSLDKQKDLYDYQKKIKKQAKEITSLQKQLAAYVGDNSEETRAKVQKLEVSLADAQEELAETQYDRYISDQKQLLDEMYNEYETILNMRLDDISTLISDMIDEVNANSVLISQTLTNTADNVGYTISTEISNIWKNSNGVNGVLTTYGDKFDTILTSVNSVLSTISANVQNMIIQLNKIAGTNVSVSQNSNTNNSQGTQTISEESKKSTTSNNTVTTKKIEVGGKINAEGAKIYSYAGDKNGAKQYFANDPIYTVLKEQNGYLQVRWHKLDSGVTGWFKKNDVKAYKIGAFSIDHNQAAWTQENGIPETIIRPSDGAILTPLKRKDMVLNGEATSNIWDMANNPTDFIRNNLFDKNSIDSVSNINNINNSTSVNMENINFNMPNVRNYEEIISAMRRDKNFEKLIQAMTIDRVNGGSILRKFRV